jgi:sarcosine oxidase subunit alpha
MLDFEGDSIAGIEGEPVACSLLAAGVSVFSRSVKYHRPRGPFCFAMACSHCLMRVDGIPNVFTCRAPARAGMRLERQNAYPTAQVDIFSAIDWMFPRGLDHHEMFAGVPVAEQVMVRVARHLAGLGILPEREAPMRLPAEVLITRVAIVGGGPAGLAAAELFASRKIPFLLFERESFLGGRLAVAPPRASAAEIPLPSAFPRGSARLKSAAIGFYEDRRGPFLAIVSNGCEGPRLMQAFAERFLIATGGHSQLLPFENNDLPGVFSGRGVGFLARRCGVVPFKRVALVGRGTEVYQLARFLESLGSQIAALIDVGGAPPADAPPGSSYGQVIKAHGRSQVTALSFRIDGRGARKVRCDAVVLSLPPSPSFELACQAGARASFRPADGVFAVEADADGQTAAPRLQVAGDITGGTSPEEAAALGRRAAESLIARLA